MKKILSILVIACIAMLFSACHKDGVYNPSKKISKIYYTNSSGEKSLDQVWTWNKNLLEKIDYYYGGSIDYTYNFTYEKNRLVRMNNYASNRSIEYKYDGNKLKEANRYANGTLKDTYTFTYEKGKIVKITDTYFSSKGIEDMEISPLQFIIPEEIYNTVVKTQKKIDNGKSTGIYHYELTWDNNNVSKIVLTVEGYAGSITIEAQYDKKNNPFYGAFISFYMENNIYNGNFSKNNVTRLDYREIYDGGNYQDIEIYEYTYDGSYPTSRRYMGDGYTTLTEFEYTK